MTASVSDQVSPPITLRVIPAGDEVEAKLRAGDEARADWLATRGWLSQDMQMRGNCVATEGLAAYGHPELVMLNVPACFTSAAEGMLGWLVGLISAGVSLVGHATLDEIDPPFRNERTTQFGFLAIDETEVPGLSGAAIRVIPLS